MPKSVISGKYCCQFFFDPHPEKEHYWVCKRCPPGRKPLKQVTKGGYANLVSHAKNCYGPTFEEEFERCMAESSQNKITNLATQKKTDRPKRTDMLLDHWTCCTEAQKTAFAWLRLII
ncbi:hypothetical protein IV203_019841 [Nitzschia inconspicua]|uniref:Uncharacterized protein n=1 Tax=Nitzschia inconspicua TaxID=303405 RepID=A0A9K3M1M5_9STRA|nr:hypothetical protein IV203_019841 [Nitzschia inconspicua]